MSTVVSFTYIVTTPFPISIAFNDQGFLRKMKGRDKDTCTPRIQSDDLETSVGSVAPEVGACAVWVTVWSFEAAQGVATVCVREEGYLACCVCVECE
jgi:hypothetical protein